jgi:uncharacterized protein YdhG (YjbR/CyaY superfamily)
MTPAPKSSSGAAADRARVREYLAKQPPDARRQVRRIRDLIRAAVPRAVDGFSYGIPAVRVDGRLLLWYAGWKAHCSLYPVTPAVRRALGRDMTKYVVSKGTIRFPLDRPLPATLIRRVAKARLAELAGRGSR